jgi:hypothetical protein
MYVAVPSIQSIKPYSIDTAYDFIICEFCRSTRSSA